MARLRTCLLAGGAEIEASLSPRFRGMGFSSAHETVLRRDDCFEVRQALWDKDESREKALGREEFCGDLRRFLSRHVPLTLAELDCEHIAETSTRTTENASKNLVTLMRFELAGKAENEGRWQATGEWELEWETESAAAEWRIVGWRPREMTLVRAPDVVFTDVTAAAFGGDATYATHLQRDTNYWRAVLDGASGIDIFGNCGVSVGDADGDGQDEIYLCQPQGLPNRLYRQTRPGVFEDFAASAGVDLLDATSMVLFADTQNRGRQDLIVVTESQPLLFLNDGHGRFTLARGAFPPARQAASLTGAALADYDRDGLLDLYVCAYGYFQGEGAIPIPTPYYDAHNGPPNRLYRNRGDGTFVDVTTASGLDRGNDRYSFACVWADLDDDGWPDLCVVNDFGRNNLYRNRHDGTFQEIAEGLPGYGSGMSAAFADLDGDGQGEFYVGNMWTPPGIRVTADPEFQARFAGTQPFIVRQFAMGNALYRKSGKPGGPDLRMEEVPAAGGARRGRWAWCSDAFDLENDGQPDLYVVNGFLSSPAPGKPSVDAYLWEEVVALSPPSSTPSSAYRAAWTAIFQLAHRGHSWNGQERNVFFLNAGNGRFADASAVSDLDFSDDGRSYAVFDYDGDGDADLVLHSRTGPQLRLLRNDLAARNHSLAIRLSATDGNRDAIGARVEVETPSGRQARFLSCGTGFLAQHSKEMIFGLGPHSEATVVRVRWPGGAASEYRGLEAGYRYSIVQGQMSPQREKLGPAGTRDSRLGTGKEANPPVTGTHLSPELTAAPASEAAPKRFSTSLIEPLPLPELALLREWPAPPASSATRSRALLWLWQPAAQSPTGLESFLQVQKEVTSRLVLWSSGDVPPDAMKQLAAKPWRADEGFQSFCSTLLAYLFDYRREMESPTGLLVELEGQDRAAGGSAGRLLKVYWGGASAKEIVRDARDGVPQGAGALPFPGRAVLCSFRRDHQLLGAALAAEGLAAEAELYLALAAQANPRDADALFNLALVRSELGKPAPAMAGARAALAVRPDFPEAENLFGILLAQSGQAEEALAHLKKATRAAPDFVEAWNNLGYTLLMKGDLTASRLALEKCLALVPDFPNALNNLGILSARQGDPEKAGELFRRALALQPENEQAANNLAVLYAKEGKTGEALETFRTLLAHNPEAGSALLNFARLELSLGKTAEARELLHAWLARHPDDVAARKLLNRAQ